MAMVAEAVSNVGSSEPVDSLRNAIWHAIAPITLDESVTDLEE